MFSTFDINVGKDCLYYSNYPKPKGTWHIEEELTSNSGWDSFYLF